MSFFGAQPRFRLYAPTGYNIPKPKGMYYAKFISRFVDPVFLNMTGFFISSIDRPVINYSIVELNQYNKKRLAQTKLTYGSLKLRIRDVADENALKLVEAYNRFYFGDFQQKNNSSWNYDITTNSFENEAPNWGLQGNQTPNDGYFFDRLEIYEFYDQTYTQTNYINPKFESVNFETLEKASLDPLHVDISMKYEGITYPAVASMITPELADMWGIGFKNDFGLPAGALRIPGVVNLINYGTGLMTNVFTSLGFGEFAAGNLAGALTQTGLAKLGPKLNTGFGKTLFNSIDKTARQLNNVQNRVATGQVVRDVASGNVSSVFKPLGF